MSTFSKRLAELLYERDITQSELAKMVNTTDATISRYISGDREPKAELVVAIASSLCVSTDYLLGREEIPVALSRDNGYEGLTDDQIEMIEIMKEEFRKKNQK